MRVEMGTPMTPQAPPCKNPSLFERLKTYVVSTPANAECLDSAPFGVPVDLVVDPLRVDAGPFLDRLQRLDVVTFGPEGLPMDKWVAYDCAQLPGFTYGFCLPVEALEDRERAAFCLPDDAEGMVPVSTYIAIPMFENGTWFGHNLASLNRAFPWRRLSHLASITKAMALRAFGCERFIGATQWLSGALHIHTRFGPLNLDTAYTPAHTKSETLTYSFDVTERSLRAAMGDPDVHIERPRADLELDAEDVAGMKDLQRQIDEERNAIRNLKAEWSLLNKPDRLQGLVERYNTYLELDALDVKQIVGPEELPARPVMLEPIGGSNQMGGYAGSSAAIQ